MLYISGYNDIRDILVRDTNTGVVMRTNVSELSRHCYNTGVKVYGFIPNGYGTGGVVHKILLLGHKFNSNDLWKIYREYWTRGYVLTLRSLETYLAELDLDSKFSIEGENDSLNIILNVVIKRSTFDVYMVSINGKVSNLSIDETAKILLDINCRNYYNVKIRTLK